MSVPAFDAKFEHACQRLTSVGHLETLQAVANINQVIVDHLAREHPRVTTGDQMDYDLLRTLWKQHERLDPID